MKSMRLARLSMTRDAQRAVDLEAALYRQESDALKADLRLLRAEISETSKELVAFTRIMKEVPHG